MVGDWVTVRLPSAPKGSCPRSKPLWVEKVPGNWQYILSDGVVYNAHRISPFFPMEHSDDFLSDWYAWDSDEQPVPPAPDVALPDIPELPQEPPAIPEPPQIR